MDRHCRLDPSIVDVPAKNGCLDITRDLVPKWYHVRLARFGNLGEFGAVVLRTSRPGSIERSRGSADTWQNQGLRLPPHGVRPLIAVTMQDQPVYAENELIVSMPPLTVSPSDTFRYRAAVFATIVPSILFLLAFPKILFQFSVMSAIMALKIASGFLLVLGVAWFFRGRPRWRLFMLELKRDLFQLISLVGSSRIYGWGVRRSLETLDSLEKGQRRKPKKEKG